MKADVKDRTRGIGGSDIHHLFSLKPYGCARNLWYEKTGVEADYPFFGNNATKRGNKLEALVAEEYAEEKSMLLLERDDAFTYEDWAVGHIDRQIVPKIEPSGVLEIKVPGERMFRKIKKEGLPDSYILQFQHYLLLTRWAWGSFAIFWADGWELLTFDMEREEKIIYSISKAGRAFWEDIKNRNAPERLNASDKRCGKCSYRTTCQGQHLLDTAKEAGEQIPYNTSHQQALPQQYHPPT